MPAYFDLGPYSRPVTTASPEAQVWFDRGLMWTYGFNHEEAAACFEQAVQADPGCAMAHWGIAYALGPNYNKPWEFFDEVDLRTTLRRSRQALERALALLDGVTPVERALVEALVVRYPTPADEIAAGGDFSAWNAAFADATASVYARWPDDVDVAAVHAAALMQLTPWQLWDLRSGEPTTGSRTMEATSVLDAALASDRGRGHPGLLHLYIHLWEMSATPERALAVGDRLRGLAPDAGHLEHMPTHLDVLCGDYRRVVASNLDAVAVDERFLAERGPMNFYSLYRSHNYHFAIYGAMFSGQSRVALEIAARLENSIPEELLRVPSPPMADWLESFVAMRVHALIRFGRWDDVLRLPLPADAELYCVTTAMTHYARGVALAVLGRVEEAETERALFAGAVARVPESRTLFNNTCADILRIAAEMLAGELAYRKGDTETAFAHLRRSVELDDGLPYDEPWGWMQPTRHALGALLLEQGAVEEAAAVYRADLGLDGTLARALQHPGNVWSLHGYHECLVRLGRSDEAAIIEQQLRLAAAVADVPITASCFCRLSTSETGSRHCH